MVTFGALPTWSTTSPTSVEVAATDETGVASVEVSVDGGAVVTTPGAAAETVVSGDGVHTVSARAVDTTGNRSAAVEQVVRIDATAPLPPTFVSAGFGDVEL